MTRRSIVLVLATAVLSGCGNGAHLAGLTTAAQPARQNAANVVPAATTSIPGYAGPAATVAVQPTVTVTTAAATSSQSAASAVLLADQQAEATDLIAENASGYQLKGWFQDLKDAVNRVITRWKLSATVRAALKKKNDEAFELHEGEIDDQMAKRTAPVTKITAGTGGSQEINMSWNSTLRGDYHLITDRVVDADGVTQTLTVTQTGTTDKGIALQLTRGRALMGTDGSYQVTTDETQGYKDGRSQVEHWVKTVKADGSETLTGSVTTVDGWRTDFNGTRDVAGKVKVTVSKIAPTTTDGAATSAP